MGIPTQLVEGKPMRIRPRHPSSGAIIAVSLCLFVTATESYAISDKDSIAISAWGG
jgi:hypothetical protein